MSNKKGIDGMYYAVCLLLGLVIGIVIIWYGLRQGILPTSIFCPSAPVA